MTCCLGRGTFSRLSLSAKQATVFRSRGLSTVARSFEWSTEWVGNNNTDDVDDEKLVVFLHGLLGNKRNVKSFASSVCKSLQVPGLLVDVRGHGDSQLPDHVPTNKSSFLDCVWDLDTTLNAVVPDIEDRELTIMGHSMGGRVTMMYAITENVVKRPAHVWLLDTVPGKLSVSVEKVLNVAKKLSTDETSLPPGIKREELTQLLVNEHVLDLGTAQWLTAAYNPKGPRKFIFDLDVAFDLLDDAQHVDLLAFIQQAREEQSVGVHMIHGGANAHWHDSNALDVLRSWETNDNDPNKFSIHTLPDAGHWVHIDDPKGLLEAVESIHKN